MGNRGFNKPSRLSALSLRGQTLISTEELLDNLGWKREVRVRYFSVLAPVPGLAILAAGISTLYYYSSLAVPGDLSSYTPLLRDIFVIASGAVLVIIGTLAQIKWSKLRASFILLRRLVLAFGLILLGFVFVIIELATDTLVCVRPTPGGFGPTLPPAQQCLQYGYAHQFLWLGALGSGMVLLGILVSALEEKRQFRLPQSHQSGLRAT